MHLLLLPLQRSLRLLPVLRAAGVRQRAQPQSLRLQRTAAPRTMNIMTMMMTIHAATTRTARVIMMVRRPRVAAAVAASSLQLKASLAAS